VAAVISVNDIITAVLALGAILVSVVALVINHIAGKRAAVSALTDLTLKVSKRAAAYADLCEGSDEQFHKAQDIEALIRQADYLVQQLGPRFPSSRLPFPETVAITLAEALERVVDPWWADSYWLIAASTSNPYFRAKTTGYWGLALWDRREYERSRRKTQEAVDGLTLPTTDAYIVRGNICLQMGVRDPGSACDWFGRARQEFGKIQEDERKQMYLCFVDDAQNNLQKKPELND
jgi:hypothetical protein